MSPELNQPRAVYTMSTCNVWDCDKMSDNHSCLQPILNIHSLQRGQIEMPDDDRQQKQIKLTAAASISQPIMNIATARITNPTCDAIYRREILYVHSELKAPFEKQQQGLSP